MTEPTEDGRPYGEREGLWRYGRGLLRSHGFASTFVRLLTYPNTPWIRGLWGPMVRAARSLSGSTTFLWNGRRLRYGPPLGERTVEVPIVLDYLDRDGTEMARILEVGNVLEHHRPFPHPVVDKYEAGPGVLAEDIVDYAPEVRFPRVISVSTLEHVGFDEQPRTPGKFRASVRRIQERVLEPAGELFVTLPLGYNPEVDRYVLGTEPRGWAWTLLRRSPGWRNLWVVAPPEAWPELGHVPPYSYDRHRLEWLAVGIWRSPGPVG